MNSSQDEAKIVLLGMFGSTLAAVVGVSWLVSGKFAVVETRIDGLTALPAKFDKLADDLAKQEAAVQVLSAKVADLKHPLDNTQANVRILIRQVNKLKPDTVISGPLNRGPYGAR